MEKLGQNMKITAIDTYPLSAPPEDGVDYGSARNLVSDRTATLVRVTTEDGVTGWGNAFGPPRTTATIIDELLADIVVGRSAYQVETLLDEASTLFYHLRTAGVMQCAISGIEIAMLDAVGKSLDVPIYELLGGPIRTSVTPYASTMYIRDEDDEAYLEKSMEQMISEGFTAAKLKVGKGLEDDLNRIRIARSALGDDGILLIDCNGNYRPSQVKTLAREAKPYELSWIEEPLPPENLEGYRELKRTIDVPLAAGEAAYSRFEFKDLCDGRTVDVVQPDVTSCGGIMEMKFIGKLASIHNVKVSPHCWASGVGLAAALQVAAVLPEYPHSINRPEPFLFEVDRAENDLRTGILEDQLELTGPSIEIPDGPGIGVTVDRDALDDYLVS